MTYNIEVARNVSSNTVVRWYPVTRYSGTIFSSDNICSIPSEDSQLQIGLTWHYQVIWKGHSLSRVSQVLETVHHVNLLLTFSRLMCLFLTDIPGLELTAIVCGRVGIHSDSHYQRRQRWILKAYETGLLTFGKISPCSWYCDRSWQRPTLHSERSCKRKLSTKE